MYWINYHFHASDQSLEMIFHNSHGSYALFEWGDILSHIVQAEGQLIGYI